MDRLDVCKVLLALEKMKKGFTNDGKGILACGTEGLRDLVSETYGISLEKIRTTPYALYNKVYKDLSNEELREYTQIKRIVKEARRNGNYKG